MVKKTQDCEEEMGWGETPASLSKAEPSQRKRQRWLESRRGRAWRDRGGEAAGACPSLTE